LIEVCRRIPQRIIPALLGRPPNTRVRRTTSDAPTSMRPPRLHEQLPTLCPAVTLIAAQVKSLFQPNFTTRWRAFQICHCFFRSVRMVKQGEALPVASSFSSRPGETNCSLFPLPAPSPTLSCLPNRESFFPSNFLGTPLFGILSVFPATKTPSIFEWTLAVAFLRSRRFFPLPLSQQRARSARP